jgi:type I restriction enzyme S subunit
VDKWRTVPLSELAEIRTGKLDSNQANTLGRYPFFTCAAEPLRINHYAFDCKAILLAGNNANGIFHINRYRGKFR